MYQIATDTQRGAGSKIKKMIMAVMRGKKAMTMRRSLLSINGSSPRVRIEKSFKSDEAKLQGSFLQFKIQTREKLREILLLLLTSEPHSRGLLQKNLRQKTVQKQTGPCLWAQSLRNQQL
jgi:hypothetical protein